MLLHPIGGRRRDCSGWLRSVSLDGVRLRSPGTLGKGRAAGRLAEGSLLLRLFKGFEEFAHRTMRWRTDSARLNRAAVSNLRPRATPALARASARAPRLHRHDSLALKTLTPLTCCRGGVPSSRY